MPTESEYAVCYLGSSNGITIAYPAPGQTAQERFTELRANGHEAFIIQIHHTWPDKVVANAKTDPDAPWAARSEAEGQVPTTATTAPTALDCDGFTKPRRTL